MTDFDALEIFLYDERIGLLTHLPGDKNLLTFNQEYIDNSRRATLSLSFEDLFGDFIFEQRPTRTRLPPFFANLLPEGHMREYLASQAKVNPQREFYLLAALGKDLPGALKVRSIHLSDRSAIKDEKVGQVVFTEMEEGILRFSLAGVQLKFSAIWENDRGLTIPVDGVGGSWIVKLPSPVYAGVAENEYLSLQAT